MIMLFIQVVSALAMAAMQMAAMVIILVARLIGAVARFVMRHLRESRRPNEDWAAGEPKPQAKDKAFRPRPLRPRPRR
jgi:hypothetical protein